MNHVDIRSIYVFEDLVGEGVYGKVRKAYRHDNPSKYFAIKSLHKKHINNQSLLEKELEILSSLDHPNIIKFFEYYEDKEYFHIIMEYCSGQELFDKFKDSKFEESRTRLVIAKIVYAIYYSHIQGIIHRDLKLENVIFENNNDDAQIKVIDWGLSTKFQKDTTRLSTKTGTPQYIAPEVFNGCYDSQCDIWSIGVISYIIIAWKFPYKGTTVEVYQNSLKHDTVNYDYPVFKTVSPHCIDFLKSCLQQDPTKRLTIKECFEHPWFNDVKSQLQNNEIDREILIKLRSYTAPTSKLQHFIEQNFINLLYNEDDIKVLRQQFQNMDSNGQGLITNEELKKAYAKVNLFLEDEEIQQIISRIDKRKNNMLDYSEFLIAAGKDIKVIDKNNIIKIFNYFDEDNTGHIDVKNLKSLLLRTMKYDKMPHDDEFQEIIKEVVNEEHKTVITLADFLRYFGIKE